MTLLRRIATEKRAFVWPIVIGLVANVLIYVLVAYPLERKVAANAQEARVASDTLRRARADFSSAKGLVQGKTQADEELRKFYETVLPTSQAAARRVTYLRLEQLARDANVRSERGTAEERRQKGSGLAKLTSTWVLSGDYRDVRQFIYDLETAPEFLVLENVALARSDQRDKELTITLQVATYYRAGNVE